MIRAHARLSSLKVFLLILGAGAVLVSGCVRTTNKDGSSECSSGNDCGSGNECVAGACVPSGTTGGITSGTGGDTSATGGISTGGASTGDTGGTSGGGNDSGGSSTGGETTSGGSSSGGDSGGGVSGGSDTGGSGTSGGNGGSGSPGPEVIDDLEDGDGRILVNSGRQGPWHAFNSSEMGPGKSVSPEMGGANGSNYAMHATGSGYTFAGLGLGLNNADSAPESAQSKPYDASAWTGVAFMAKAGSTGTASLRVEAPMRDFVPPDRGGSCAADCWNVYGFSVTNPLSTDWQEIRVPFASMKRETGTSPAFDAKQLMTLSFKHTGNNDHFD